MKEKKLRLYYVSYTYAANYSSIPTAVRASSLKAAAQILLGPASIMSADFKAHATVTVTREKPKQFTNRPTHAPQ